MPPRISTGIITTPKSETKLVMRSSPSSSQNDDSNSASSTLFYLSRQNYSDVDSAYLTSEEIGYEEDEFSMPIPPAALILSGPSTPICSNSSKHGKLSSYGSCSSDQTGIHLNQVMASLLGITFLPFDGGNSLDARPSVEEDNSISSDEFSFDDEGEEREINDICDLPIDLGADPSFDFSSGGGRKKRTGPLRRLRRQLTNHNKQNKVTRKRLKQARGKAKHCDLINGTSANIDSEMRKIEAGRRRLHALKAGLRTTQTRAKKLVIDAQHSANRVSKISKTIVELECRLDMSLKALEQERDNLDSNLSELAHLNASKQALGDESKHVESLLRNQLSRLESNLSTPMARANGVELGESTHTPTPMSDFNIRRRAETDGSFKTAAEAHPSTADRSRRRCVSEDIRPKSSVGGKEGGSLSLANTRPSTVSRASSFLRIHDLDVDDQDFLQRQNSRTDLFEIHSDDGHLVLNLLMKRAFECVTDEGPRWTADRTTAKIISKRPASEKSWHYATESDIFIWYGKFDNGYKSDVPVIKGRAIVECTPRELIDLIFDSSKVKQYNKMSLGREDRHFFKENVDTHDGKIAGEAKIVRSVSNIPMLKKNLEVVSLMHGRSLDEEKDGMRGYMIANRSIWEDEKKAPSDDEVGAGPEDPKFIRAECLLGVSLIREIEGDKCEITTVNHFFTPGTPSFGARQFGMKAAANYLRDVQSQFKKV